jgi:hypothetical protein
VATTLESSGIDSSAHATHGSVSYIDLAVQCPRYMACFGTSRSSAQLVCVHACRYLQEIEALQEMLLRAGCPPDSRMLASRVANKSDLVAQTLISLAATAQRPEATWENLQTATARSHARWAELCMRTMHAAVVANVKVPYTEWCQSMTTTITRAAEIPRLQFRKLGVESQMELMPNVQLIEDEVAEVRSRLSNINA